MKGTIAEQLKFIRNKLYEYCDHSSYEGVEIIRDMIKTGKISQEKPLPIVFTSMLFGNLPNLSEMDVVYSQSQTSQVSLDNQTYKLEDGGLIVWDFIKKIYPETMVEEMFSYYCMVIEQLSKNDGELKCSPAFEKKIKLYNSTEKEIDFFNLGKRLDNIFYKFADKIAITDFEGGITYRELERNIKSTMHDLKKNGIKPGKYVVIKTDKSKESIITILAVVLAGATYVPVEKHWPVERVQYILDNAGADMIIDPYEVCSSNEVNDSWKNIDVESSTYVIYTSGSTGKPKGVEIAYKSMVNTVLDMPLQEGLILERLVEEYSDTEVFQNFENISVDTDLICLDADHTNYSILIQLAKKGVNVLCQGLWNVENYLDVIREFKRNNKFVIEDESFLNFEKVSIFVDIAKKLLAFDPAAEIEIKTNCFNIYAAVRILGMFLPNMQQMTVEQHVEQDSKEWVWCRLRNKIVVFEIDKKIYYGLERKYTAKSVEFNIQTDRGNLSLRGYLGPIIWEGFFPEISNNENSKGYLFHPTIQTVDGEANYDCYINTVYSNSLASEIKKTERYIKRQENVASKMQQQILNIRCSQELLSKLNFSLKCKKEYHPLLLEELLDLRTESEIENIFDNFSQEYIQYSVEMRKKILAQTILFYMNKKGVLLKDIPCTLNQILKCLSVNTDNNDIIYRWIELLKKYNYVTETDGIYVCKIEIYEKGLKYGWEEVEYLWKGKLESPLVLDYIINNIKNWDKLIQKEQQATLLLFEQGEDIYADALYKETKILQYLNHSLSKKVLGYLYENANATILEIGAGTGATSDKVLSDIRENKFEEHIVYFYTDISRFFLQRAKERYKECDGKIEMHYQTLDIDEAFSSQLPSNFQADIVIAVGVLNNSVNTDKCIYEINSVMKPGGILLIIETVEDVPDILITQSFMMTEPKDQRKATNTMFLNRKQWLEILEENGFCNSEEFPGYGEYLEVLGQKLFYCTKE